MIIFFGLSTISTRKDFKKMPFVKQICQKITESVIGSTMQFDQPYVLTDDKCELMNLMEKHLWASG